MATLTYDGTHLVLKCRFEEKELAKTIQGRKWDARRKSWTYPARPETLDAIRRRFLRLDVDPMALAAVQAIRESEEEVQAMKDAGRGDATPLAPMPVKIKPFSHQVLGYNIGLTLPASAILMEQGCGKSLTTIAVAGRRFLEGEITRMLVIAPSSVVPVWGKEFLAYADFPYEIRELTGPVRDRAFMLDYWEGNPEALQVACTNYESTWRMEKALLEWAKTTPTLVVLDESQRVKTPSARQSKTCHKLGKAAAYRMILTGTPVTQSPMDFYSQYRFLDPSIFGTSYYAYRSRYALMGGFEKKQVVGYQNMEELTQKAHAIAYRVTKAEALDLPEQIDQELYCELEPKAKRLYREMELTSVAELEELGTEATAQSVLTRLLRLSQITGGHLPDDETDTLHLVSEAKHKMFKEAALDLLEAGKKVVVFARFLPEIRRIVAMLERTEANSRGQGIGYACITGATKDRGEEVRRFQEDPDCRVFVAQIQTAGLGITLTAADTAIFYSVDYSFANYDQARARLHRIGQKNNVTYIHLIAQDTVDEKILGILREKRSVAQAVVDDWKQLFTEKGRGKDGARQRRGNTRRTA